jgi:hypothetical protein
VLLLLLAAAHPLPQPSCELTLVLAPRAVSSQLAAAAALLLLLTGQ